QKCPIKLGQDIGKSQNYQCRAHGNLQSEAVVPWLAGWVKPEVMTCADWPAELAFGQTQQKA
ncbi:hypothetical protein, partial [Planktomarina sp.]|uniref:hypothetical protein n=1 Tax=Planktomarina sp. TaxID=2024851 RepID=UPI0032608C40